MSRLKPWAQRGLEPFVGLALRLDLSPDQVSVASFVVAVLAATAFYLSTPAWLFLGSVLVVVSGLLDVVDGEVARRAGRESRRGDYLDHVLDRYSDVVLLLGVTAAADSWLLGVLALTGVVLTSYMGTQAQAVGGGREYGGLVGRSDRLALIAAAGVLAALGVKTPVFPVLAWALVLLAVLGNFTALQRFVVTWRSL